jgi:hypothetical protein
MSPDPANGSPTPPVTTLADAMRRRLAEQAAAQKRNAEAEERREAVRQQFEPSWANTWGKVIAAFAAGPGKPSARFEVADRVAQALESVGKIILEADTTPWFRGDERTGGVPEAMRRASLLRGVVG